MGGFFNNKYSQSDIDKANKIDIEQFLIQRGEKLLSSGKDKRLQSNHSITIRGNQWFDHATQQGGYAISFVCNYYNLKFKEAMEMLLTENNKTFTPCKHKEKSKNFILPSRSKNMKRTYGYLLNCRKLNADIVNHFVKQQLIFEDSKYHNVVFVGRDENGIPRHANKRSTLSSGTPFKQNSTDSDPSYSFHWTGTSSNLFVFEAPIDMLSYISMNMENWQDDNYVSLCGVTDYALLKQLELNKNISNIFLCLDNDEGGQAATQRLSKELKEKGYKNISVLVPQFKDWNDDLVNLNLDDQKEGITLAL